jgi:hypothetical protein
MPAPVPLSLHLAFVFRDSLGTVQNVVHKWGPAFIGLGKKLQMLEMTQGSCNPGILWIGMLPTLPFD